MFSNILIMFSNMKQVGIREAQTNLSSLLQELPFAISKYGKEVAWVVAPHEAKENVTEDIQEVPQNVTDHREGQRKPSIQELREQVASIPSGLEKKEEWGIASLHCQYCGVSPAVMFNYTDENGDEFQAYVCQTHLQRYQTKPKMNYGVVRQFNTAPKVFQAFPKPEKKEKKK